MRLHQREFCHNCNNWADFEFEDVCLRQVIHCPLCGHEHFREIDEGTLTKIRIDHMRVGRVVRIAKMPPMTCRFRDYGEEVTVPPINIEERQVLGRSSDGCAILDKKEDEAAVKVITNRRW